MQLIKLRALCLATLLVYGFSNQAMADMSQNIYAGIGLGMSNYSSFEDLFLAPEENSNLNIDDSPIGYQFFAGWEFVPRYLALEFSYIDFGAAESDYSEEETVSGNAVRYEESVNVTTTAIGISLKGMLPLGESLSVFGKLGYATWEAEGKLKYDEYFDGDLDNSYSATTDDIDGNDFFYSIGAEYHHSKNLSLYAEYLMQEAEHDVGGQSYNFFEASIISAGIQWRFDAPKRRSGRRGSDSDGEPDGSGKRNITACDEKYKDISGIICRD